MIGRLQRDFEWNYGVGFYWKHGLCFNIWFFKVKSFKAWTTPTRAKGFYYNFMLWEITDVLKIF